MEYRLKLDGKNYQIALNLIPDDYRHCYHELMVLGAEYTVVSFDIRRGQEGIAYLKKEHFQLVEKDGYKFLQKVRILAILLCNVLGRDELVLICGSNLVLSPHLYFFLIDINVLFFFSF